MTRVLAIAALFVAASAHGDPTRLEVAVGKTVEVDVGYARGLLCDDTTFIDAQLVTRGESNVFVVKGLSAGATLCRVGTDLNRVAHFVFDVRVVQAPAKGHS
jgi:hypothetical protein